MHKFFAPITDGDSYRQGATASIARNYYEKGYSVFSPRITGWGTLDQPEIWPNEFPLYPYLISRIYFITGEKEWVGRIITILFCLIGALGLYDLVRRYDNTRTALFAAMWYLITPQAIYHGRCFHRFPFAIGLALIGLAAYARWLENRNRSALVCMTLCWSLALLMMPPLATLAIPAYWMYRHRYGWKIWKCLPLWVCCFLLILPSILWYGWAIQQPQSYSLHSLGRETFRNWTSLSYYTLWWKYDFFRRVLWILWFYTMGPVGAFLGIFGLFLNRGKLGSLPLVWAGTVLAYYLFDIHPTVIAPHYVYYLIILPSLCWGAARASNHIYESLQERALIPRLSLKGLLVSALILTSIFHWNNMIQPWYRVKHTWMNAAEIVQANTPDNAKLLVDTFDPSFLYYCKRNGVAKNPGDLTVETVEMFVAQGATHLAIVNEAEFLKNDKLRFYLKDSATNVTVNDQIRLYQLGSKAENP